MGCDMSVASSDRSEGFTVSEVGEGDNDDEVTFLDRSSQGMSFGDQEIRTGVGVICSARVGVLGNVRKVG